MKGNSERKLSGRKLLTVLLMIVISLLTLEALSVFSFILTPLSVMESFRMIFGIIYVLFLPGFVLSFVIFRPANETDWIERIVLSLALSIAVVPLIVFYLYSAGISISQLNVSLTILGIVSISGIILCLRR
jgi:uncharacterized membrane protein